MRATSPAQETAWREGQVPGLELARDDVGVAGIPMGAGHIPTSLVCLFRDADGDVHVVDPGLNSEAGWDALTGAIRAFAGDLRRVRTIIVTHAHPDHGGLAGRLSDETGARVVLHEADESGTGADRSPDRLTHVIERWGIPADRRKELSSFGRGPKIEPVSPDLLVRDGDVVGGPGVELEVVATPGHTPGSICLVDRARGLLLTGDHLLPVMFGGIGLGPETDDNPLAQYHAGLDRLEPFGEYEAVPGHGYRFRGVAERVAQTRRHHDRRSDEVAAILAADPDATTWEVASRITWTAGWAKLKGFYLFSALHQTDIHRDYVSGRHVPAAS